MSKYIINPNPKRYLAYCKICKTPFLRENVELRYCSDECRKSDNKK